LGFKKIKKSNTTPFFAFLKFLIFNNFIHNSSDFDPKNAYKKPPMTTKYYNNAAHIEKKFFDFEIFSTKYPSCEAVSFENGHFKGGTFCVLCIITRA
jgi:hypothetical protein